MKLKHPFTKFKTLVNEDNQYVKFSEGEWQITKLPQLISCEYTKDQFQEDMRRVFGNEISDELDRFRLVNVEIDLTISV